MIKENRKEYPVYSGLIKYFPDAILDVSNVSFKGNRQHHNDKPLHWDRDKSSDHLDAAMRHLIDYSNGAEFDSDGTRHLSKVAWRILAQLQIDLEGDK